MTLSPVVDSICPKGFLLIFPNQDCARYPKYVSNAITKNEGKASDIQFEGKNGLHVCPNSNIISKSSLSRTRSVQNTDKVADLIQTTHDVPIYYNVYTCQDGRSGNHVNDLVDELHEKQQPSVSGSANPDTMHIPYLFAMKHLPNCKVKILLHNLKGKTWTVNSIPTTRVQISHTFCGGWLSFVGENNIDLGDIRIFELVRKCGFNILVLRVKKEGGNVYGSKVVHEGLAADYAKISRCKSRKVGENSNRCSHRVEKVVTYDKKGSAHDKEKHGNMLKNHHLHCQSKISSGDSAIRKPTTSQDKQGSFTKSCMSLKSVPEDKLAAEYFISNFPHFVRIMKKFNIRGSYTLKVRYRFSMEHFPSYRTDILLHNLKGECWPVNSIPTVKVQTLHIFCGGWSTFVRENDIQMIDICIFELIGKCKMHVHICAVGKNGLAYQNGITSNESTILASLTC